MAFVMASSDPELHNNNNNNDVQSLDFVLSQTKLCIDSSVGNKLLIMVSHRSRHRNRSKGSKVGHESASLLVSIGQALVAFRQLCNH